MDRAVALKKLVRILGKDMGYRVDPKAPKQEERDEARAMLSTATIKRDAWREAREQRMKELLAADEQYQQLNAKAREAADEVKALASIVSHYKITVGTSGGMFFTVRAQGDTWEEVIDLVTKRAAA